MQYTFKQLANIIGMSVEDITGCDDPSVNSMIATGTIMGDEIIAEMKQDGLIA